MKPLSARVTSAEVARLADVSQSAVSRTFTPGASVAPETRQRVLDAARQLGYRPNAIARSLISGRSRIIGLVAAYLDNQFYPIVLEQLALSLQARGYQTLLFMSDTGAQDHELEKLLSYQVDGVVMASATLSSELASECCRAAIPVVLFNRELPGSPASSVVSDNLDGGRQVADFLVDGGHRRIAFIAGDEDSSTNHDRELGFRQQLARRSMPLHARAVGRYDSDAARNAALTLMSAAEPPDAIFVANDHMAFAVMDALREELGVSVPDQVSVIGFDDVPEAAWRAYDLTSVRQHVEPLIEATVSTLFQQIENGKTESRRTCVPVSLSVRRSARLPDGHGDASG